MASVETVEGGENPGRSACWESVSVRAPHQPVTESSYCSWSAGEERQEAGERNRKEGNGRESMEGVGGGFVIDGGKGDGWRGRDRKSVV